MPAVSTCSSISARVERAGISGLNEGQKIAYEIVADKRTGKSSADNLKPG
jgi:CspA family cold shock protein